jgi:broad-specificity NMP kinase
MNDMDELSAQYIRLRQKREILKERFTAEDGELEKAMAEIEAQLLDTLNASNSNSMSTNSAVIIRTVRKRYMPSNWNAVYELIKKHDAYSLLEKRVHNGNMKDFLEEHPDEYPAGMNVDSRYAVTVRRKNQGE